mgnify:CR=1 FL=1
MVYIVWMTPIRWEEMLKECFSPEPPFFSDRFTWDLRKRGFIIKMLKKDKIVKWIKEKVRLPPNENFFNEINFFDYFLFCEKNSNEKPSILILIREVSSGNPSVFSLIKLMRRISRDIGGEFSSTNGIILGSDNEEGFLKILFNLYITDLKEEPELPYAEGRYEEFEKYVLKECEIYRRRRKKKIKTEKMKIFYAAGYFIFLHRSLDKDMLSLVVSALSVRCMCSFMLDIINKTLEDESKNVDPLAIKESLERLSRLWDIFYNLRIEPPLEPSSLRLFNEVYKLAETEEEEKFTKKKFEALQASVTSLLNQKNMEALSGAVDEMEKSSVLSERTSKALNMVNFIISLLAVFELGQFLQEFDFPLALIAFIMISVFIGLLVLIAKVPEYIISRSLPEIRREIIEEIRENLKREGGGPDSSFKLIFADLSGYFWRIGVERKQGKTPLREQLRRSLLFSRISGLGGSNAYYMTFVKGIEGIKLSSVVERISGRKSSHEKAVEEISAFLKKLGAEVKNEEIILEEESIKNFVFSAIK